MKQAMGKGSAKGKTTASKKAMDIRADPEFLKAVKTEWALAKSALRPYAGPDGSVFFARNKSDSKFLDLNNLASHQAPDTTELVNRLGIALSEAAGTFGSGGALFTKYLPDKDTALQKLGLTGVMEELTSDAGVSMLKAATALNKHSPTAKTKKEEIAAAAKDWLAFFDTDSKAKAKKFARLAQASAKLYILSMEALQWLAAAQDKAGWAAKFKTSRPLQPAAVQSWLRKPGSKDRLLEALVESHMAQVSTPKAHDGLSSSSDEGAPAAADPKKKEKDDSSSSSTLSKKPKRRRSPRRARQRAGKKLSSSLLTGSSSSSTKKKDKKKAKDKKAKGESSEKAKSDDKEGEKEKKQPEKEEAK